jgi:hypothetical protein
MTRGRLFQVVQTDVRCQPLDDRPSLNPEVLSDHRLMNVINGQRAESGSRLFSEASSETRPGLRYKCASSQVIRPPKSRFHPLL